MRDPAVLAALERTLLQELLRAWVTVNHNHFREAMKPPRFELIDGDRHLGEWRRGPRVIAFSRTFVNRNPWGVVVEVLKHEMAHQYAHEVLGAVDETAHGPAFRQVCERLGIDAAASGLPRAAEVDPEQDRVLRRVQKLLALAESPNANESQAAASAARKLMLRYNIDALPTEHGFRHLGEPTGRLQEADRWLATVLGDHFFVNVIWVPVYDVHTGRTGRVLEICGTPPNLELATYVHGFLKETSERLWRQHKRAHRIVGDKERQRFVAGVMRGFHEKLQEGARESREEGLVWVGDPALDRYMGQRYPRVRHVKYGGKPRTEAWEQGRAAGREIVLHKPVEGKASGGAPKLLKG
ncbi:MAG: SprT-like domain-containing protein [Myxococcota bacterium]